jgi:hypothetical protein
MNNISDFMGTFRSGFQRSARFVCQVLIPPTLIVNVIKEATRNPALSGNILGVVREVLDIENSVLAVPQVVKWLAQGYLVQDARLPDRGYGMVDLSMYGITEHFPFHTEYSALQCTFMMPYATNISNDNAVPRFFNYWQNVIQHNSRGPESGFDFGFPSDYYSTVLLTLLDRKNRGTITYKFDNAYPKSVDSAQLSWSDDNKFLTLPVNFNFSYWTVLPVAESLALSLVDQVLS